MRPLGLKSLRDWRVYSASGKPADIPSSPQTIYAGEGWTSWGDWLGTGRVRNNGGFLPYGEANDLVRRLGLKGQKEWRAWAASGKRPLNIPANPEKIYAGNGWTNCGDWLGTGRIGTKQIGSGFLPYDEANDSVRPLGLKGYEGWAAYCKSGQRPANIPASPQTVYAGKGWTNWSDWVGTERTGFLPYGEANAFVGPLGLKSVRDWGVYSASGKRPANIPASPNVAYAGKGWTSWSDWLGTGRVRSNGDFLPYDEARDFVRALGLKSTKEWLDYCRSGKRLLNIPSNPQKAYAGKGWTNRRDWLGTGNTKNSSLPFEEARAFVRGLGLKGGTEWKAYCKSGKKPVTIPSNPSTVYAGKGWTTWSDWGCCRGRRTRVRK